MEIVHPLQCEFVRDDTTNVVRRRTSCSVMHLTGRRAPSSDSPRVSAAAIVDASSARLRNAAPRAKNATRLRAARAASAKRTATARMSTIAAIGAPATTQARPVSATARGAHVERQGESVRVRNKSLFTMAMTSARMSPPAPANAAAIGATLSAVRPDASTPSA